MITIKEEWENYSFSKIFSNFYYLFKRKTSSSNGANSNKKSPSLLRSSTDEFDNSDNNSNNNHDDINNIIETITDTTSTPHSTTLKNRYIGNKKIKLNKKNNHNHHPNNNNNNHHNHNHNNNQNYKNQKQIQNTNNISTIYHYNKNNNLENINKKTKYSLNNHTETPEHLVRPFIYEGYRVDFSYWLSLKSIFIFGHNDFSNIHSHLIPALYFVHILYNIIFNNKYDIVEVSDKIMFSIFIGSATCTFVCSVLYHAFGCHSYSTYKKLLLCDYLGIILLIGSSFYPSLFYTYKCYKGLMIFYMFTITFLCTSLMALIFVPRFQELHTLRNTLFSATALFGVFPALHTFFIFDSEVSLYFVKRIFTMFLIFGLGLFFYIYKLPESIIPVIGEKYFSSHSIWHVFTALGPLYHLDSCLLLFNEMSKLSCTTAPPL